MKMNIIMHLKNDYDTLVKRNVIRNNKLKKILVPPVPFRANDKEGYIKEINEAGLILDIFIKMKLNNQCPNSIALYIHKP